MPAVIPDSPSGRVKAAAYLEKNQGRLKTFSEQGYVEWPGGSVHDIVDKELSPKRRKLFRVAARIRNADTVPHADVAELLSVAYALMAVVSRTRYATEICTVVGEALAGLGWQESTARRWLLDAITHSCQQIPPLDALGELLELGVADPFKDAGL